MRAHEILSEIERLYHGDYTGGKGELSGYKNPGNKSLKPLPGGSGLKYTIKQGTSYDATSTYIFIIDPKSVSSTDAPKKHRFEFDSEYATRLRAWEKTNGKSGPAIVAKLSVSNVDLPIPNAVQVGSITVDEDYRGIGLAKALYGIVLTIMGKTLVAGGEQTPGGRRNWLSLVNIPGVEVKGFVQLDDEEVNPNDSWADEADVDKNHDILMKLGGQYIGQNRWSELWAFDVVPGKGELKPAIRTTLSQVYDDYGSAQTGLFARWVG
jgi:hypothetical protein